jgi:hypothetical protein
MLLDFEQWVLFGERATKRRKTKKIGKALGRNWFK